jgi:signal transduction histidine kinase
MGCSIAAVSLVIAVSCSIEQEAAHGPRVDLSGRHPFAPDDDPAFADPDFDDSAWARAEVPGSWSSQGISPAEGIGWYRIRFSVPEDFDTRALAVDMGKVVGIDETFLNGERVGGEGRFGGHFVSSAVVDRVYPMPEHLLRRGGDNVLAVRLFRIPGDTAGIVAGRPAVGESEEVLTEVRRRLNRNRLLDAFVLGAFVPLWAFFLILGSGRRREYLSFWAFLTINLATITFDSSLLHGTPLRTPVTQWLSWACQLMLPALFLGFVNRFGGGYPRALMTVTYGLCGAMVVVTVLFPSGAMWVHVLGYVWWGVVFAVTGASLYRLVRSRRGPVVLTRALLFGASILAASVIADFLLPEIRYSWLGIRASSLGMLAFTLAVEFGIARRLLDSESRARALSDHVMDAQERERRHISSELHDGVGQTLAAVKLGLQVAEARAADPGVADAFRAAANGVRDAVDEIRRVSLALHPSATEERGIAGAMESYCRAFSGQTGVKVDVDVSTAGGLDVEPRVAANLFRSMQEAVGNAARHGHASLIRVVLGRTGSGLRMIVEDDGCGFDAGDAPDGLGLRTLRERAELLGGTCAVQSRPGGGTVVRVEVPA